MDILFSLLQKIREKPGLYIGEPSLLRLFHYINGYNMCAYEANINYHHCLEGFNEYVNTFYGCKHTSKNWEMLITEHSGNYSEAFYKFYELLEEYLKLTGETSGIIKAIEDSEQNNHFSPSVVVIDARGPKLSERPQRYGSNSSVLILDARRSGLMSAQVQEMIDSTFATYKNAVIIIDTRGSRFTPTQVQEMINRIACCNKEVREHIQIWTDQSIVFREEGFFNEYGIRIIDFKPSDSIVKSFS